MRGHVWTCKGGPMGAGRHASLHGNAVASRTRDGAPDRSAARAATCNPALAARRPATYPLTRAARCAIMLVHRANESLKAWRVQMFTVIVLGNASERCIGMECHGPFADADAALQWAEVHVLHDREFAVIELEHVEEEA